MDRLQGLLNEVQLACDARLKDIAAQERQQAARLRKEAKAHFKLTCQALTHRREQHLHATVSRRLRLAEEAEKIRYWNAERACFDELMCAIRKALEGKPASQAWFDAHLVKARQRLATESTLQITLNAAWRSSIRVPPGIEVRTAPLIGGFRLADSARGIEVDASWERRLEDIRDRLWQQWHERIHHQD